MGMPARKIIVTPCMVKTWVYTSADSSLAPGTARWVRISSASDPPTSRKKKAATPYMMPIFLWSTVNSHDFQPWVAVGRANTPKGLDTVAVPLPSSSGGWSSTSAMSSPSGPSPAGLLEGHQVGDELIDLGLRELHVRHALVVLGAHGLDGFRVALPVVEVGAVRDAGGD